MKQNENRIEEVGKVAYRCEQEYGGCAQCVLAGFKETFDFISGDVFKSASGLAGGLGLTGDTCGALIAGSLILSIRRGRTYDNMKDSKRVRFESYEMVKELRERFKQEYGTSTCSEVQSKLMGRSFNLWDEEEFDKFEKSGGHDDKCPSVCKKTAIWTAEILEDRDLI